MNTWATLFLACLIISQTDQKRAESEQRDKLEDYEEDERTPEQMKAINVVIYPKESPEQLLEAHTAWMTPKHKLLVKKAVDKGANEWERIHKIADIYYDQHRTRRNISEKALDDYCQRNLRRLIGDDEFDQVSHLYAESATIEHIETAFYSSVAKISDEEKKNQAEQYGQFCRKIYRLVSIEPNQMMSWLTQDQIAVLKLLITDPKVSDDDVYDRMYAFYNETEEKEEAQEAIDGACRRFLAASYGDDVVEELELMKEAEVNPQIMANRLAQQVEIDDKNSGKSLWLCKNVYLGYDGICECNGHADACDEKHACVDCRDNTDGSTCERCVEDYELRDGECSRKCECFNHAEMCDDDAVCMNCTHNTVGDHCEDCDSGFRGNAQLGTPDACEPIPCENNDCSFNNETDLMQDLNQRDALYSTTDEPN